MSQQSDKARASVTWLTPEIAEPTEGQKIAKAVDDQMNNETEEVVLPEEDKEPQSLGEALTGECDVQNYTYYSKPCYS